MQSAGVEVVKHQTHIVEDEMSIEAKNILPGNSQKLFIVLWKIV